VSTLSGFVTPAVVSSQLNYAVSPNQIKFTFNMDVGASAFNLAALSIAGSAGLPALSPTAFIYDPATRTAAWTLPQSIANGTYTATLSAGTILSQSSTLNFFTLLGDANHDGVVNTSDFSILAANFNSATGMSAATGDFNGDGIVNAEDFEELAANYGQNLFAPPAAGEELPQSLGAQSVQQSTLSSMPTTAQSSSPANLFSAQPIERLDLLSTDSARLDAVL
jgi:hypothetical protein